MDSLEQKEIRGLNLKAVIAIAFSMVTIIGTVLKTYYNLKEEISRTIQTKESDDKFTNYRLQQIEAHQIANDARINELEKEHNYMKK